MQERALFANLYEPVREQGSLLQVADCQNPAFTVKNS